MWQGLLEARAASHRRDSLPTGAALLLPSDVPPSTLPAPEPHHLPTLAQGALQTRLGDVRLNSVDFLADFCNNFPLRLKLSCSRVELQSGSHEPLAGCCSALP